MKPMLVVLALLVGGCSASTGEPRAATGPSAVDSPSSTTPTDLAGVAHDARSHRLGAYVERAAGGLHVVSWWGCAAAGCPDLQVIDDRTADGAHSYRRWTQRRWSSYGPPSGQPVSPVVSTDDASSFDEVAGR